MLVMQFSQEGIDELRKYQEHMEMRHPEGDFVLSDGFDEGALGGSSQGGLAEVLLLMLWWRHSVNLVQGSLPTM
jgi:hypothetical protein